MASRIARIASLPIVLMVGTSAAWTGRGDIDPNHGEGGAVSIFNNVLLALPGDRLVIAGQGFGVRMVDAAGQNVSDFGEGGVIIINSWDATRNFSPKAAALAPNGDMIFAGQTSTRALLRLAKDGKPVPSFGNSGDRAPSRESISTSRY